MKQPDTLEPVPVPAPAGPPRLVYHKGRLCPDKAATLPLSSIALRYGISVFEGIRLYAASGGTGKVEAWLLEPHLDRLRESCRTMGLDAAVCDAVPEVIAQLVAANAVTQDSYVRVAVSAGSAGGIGDPSESVLTVSVTESGRKRWLSTGEGMRLTVSDWQRPAEQVFPSAAKNISAYAGPRLALAAARAAGYDNCVLRTRDGLISETPTATLFLVEHGRLVTPRLADAVLPGVTRAWVLAAARELGLDAAAQPVTVRRLAEADEVFLCGTGAEFGPVKEIDGLVRPGWPERPVTEALIGAYFRQVRGDAPVTHVSWSATRQAGATGPAAERRVPVTSTIDWPRALSTAQNLVADPDTTDSCVRAALAQAPVFQNRDFDFSPMPVLIRAAAAEELRPALAAYVELLGEVVRHYREQPEVRAWFGLPDAADRLIAADHGPGDAPWVCRLDGYLEQNGERLVLLENNADAPAGTLFTARVNETVRAVTHALARDGARGRSPDPDPRLSDLTYLGGSRFLDALLAGAKATAERFPGKVARPRTLVILQLAGAVNRESAQTAEEFTALGLDTFIADPRDLRVVGERARFGDREADLCWNKVNTVAWGALTHDEEFVRVWESALRDTPLVHLNPFGARYVAESKLSLAFVQEPRFADLFTEWQRALAASLLPWTRRVTRDAACHDGSGCLVEDLRERQGSYVLKEPYDIRGDGVTIGDAVPRSTWLAAVERAVEHGHVAQRRVKPLQYPVVAADGSGLSPMSISLDAYVFGGEVAGFGSKASHHAKVNVFQGGRKLAVHVTAGGGA